MITPEARYKWWEGTAEDEQWLLYVFHLVFDCNIPLREAVPLAQNNFNTSIPDPLDTLLAQLEKFDAPNNR